MCDHGILRYFDVFPFTALFVLGGFCLIRNERYLYLVFFKGKANICIYGERK